MNNGQLSTNKRTVGRERLPALIFWQRYLVVYREFSDEIAILPDEQIEQCKHYVRTKDVSYVESKTIEGLDHVIVIIARNLKSKQKTDTLAE